MTSPPTRRLRVLHLLAAPFPAPFGSQVYAARLAAAVARRGHVVVLGCYGAGEGPGPVDVRVVRGLRLPGAGFARSGPHWSRALHDVLLAAAVRHAGPFDLVHAHNVEAPVVARAASPWTPVIYGQHTAMAEELPEWFPLPGAGRVGRLVDAVVPRVASASIALSEAGRQTLTGHRYTVPPGIDLADLADADGARARRRWDLGPGPWVVYAGNADPYQDVDRWLEAMVRVPANALLVTGHAAQPWRDLGDRLGLGTRLRVVGGATFADCKDALAAADVAVCPRRRCAGFPMKLLNQLALGVPTVCAPGSARPIPGVVAAADDSIDALADALRDLLADTPRRRALSAAARNAVARWWTWDARAAEVEAVYLDVLARREGRSRWRRAWSRLRWRRPG